MTKRIEKLKIELKKIEMVREWHQWGGGAEIKD